MENVSRLDLRFDLPEPEKPNCPVVTVLVDGEELLRRVGGPKFMGFDPAKLLSQSAPLLPTSPPRRVAVYRCECGEVGDAMVPDDRFELVERAYALSKRDGLTMRQIADLFNAEGVATGSGRGRWQSGNVTRLVHAREKAWAWCPLPAWAIAT